MSEETKAIKPYGLQWWLCGIIMLVVIAAAATGALSTDLAGSFALMLSIGILCNEIGERIPIWNSYVGGGLVLAFLVSAFLFTYNLIPQKYAEAMVMVMDEADFLSFFIIFLITGSILALDRKLLIRSFAGYIPAIFGGLIGAGVLGILAGLAFGISPTHVLLK
ncbi:MAG: 2-hydroxycarboxylate transporter family protein, partial [Clostridium sp.]|nr:2-hydroxycarboxylate transporter family protein [Clostridium sp.]